MKIRINVRMFWLFPCRIKNLSTITSHKAMIYDQSPIFDLYFVENESAQFE